MNVSTSTKNNSLCLLCTVTIIGALLPVSLEPFIASWLIGLGVVTERTSWPTSQKWWRYNFCCKALWSKKLTRLRSELLGGKLFCCGRAELRFVCNRVWPPYFKKYVYYKIYKYKSIQFAECRLLVDYSVKHIQSKKANENSPNSTCIFRLK